MKLITELAEDVNFITESEGESSEKKYFIEGIIMQSNIKNRNGRVYPAEILFNEMDRYNTEYVSKKRAYGELNHPNSPTVNLDRASHLFTELRRDGDNVVGRAKVLAANPMGKIVKGIIDEGGALGISSRGVGSLRKNSSGIMEVQHDFRLSTAGDIVADPSAPHAFVNGIMENVEWVLDAASGNWVAMQVVEEIRDQGRKNAKQLQEQAVKSFERFMTSLLKSQNHK